MYKLKDIKVLADVLAPEKITLDWDNSGLQIGDLNETINSILLTLDINEMVIDEAVRSGCQLIISHHPILFKAVKKISREDYLGRLIYKAIRNNISIFSMHTNFDLAKNGINDLLANLLGLKDIRYLEKTKEEAIYKLIVYIPEDHFESLKNEILNAGAGRVGNYSHSSHSQLGESTFMPLCKSSPFIGEKGKINKVREYRFETIVLEEKLKEVIDLINKYHPYEEPAYDVFSLSNQKLEYGLGRIGFLKEEILYKEFLNIIKKSLKIEQLRFVGDLNDRLSCVAICSGSGADLIETAAKKGADLLVTADIKYHQAQYAEQLGINLVDAGHYQTEQFVKTLLYDYFHSNLDGVKLFKSELNTDPWKYLK